MAADVSAFVYFLPILAFLVSFAIMYALLSITKVMGEHAFLHLIFSFIFATIFITATSVRQLVINVIPWFAVLSIALVMIMLLVKFMGKGEVIGTGFTWVFIVILIMVFFVSGVKVFSATIGPYLPGSSDVSNADPVLLNFFDWLYAPRVAGFFLIIIVAVVVSWVLVKTGSTPAKK